MEDVLLGKDQSSKTDPAGITTHSASQELTNVSAQDVKEITEVIRALNPTILSIQRGISRVVTPFFLLTIVFFLTIFETGVPGFANFDTISYGGYVNGAGQYSGGMTFENVRSVALFLMAVTLFYMFVRFGYFYYQGNKLIASLQAFLNNNLRRLQKPELSQILSHVCKENYLIQAMVVLRQDSNETGLDGSRFYVFASKTLSVALIIIFVFFMGFSQYLIVMYLANTFALFAVLALIVFLVYYAMFAIGLVFAGAFKADGMSQKYSPFIMVVFSIFIIINAYHIVTGFQSGIDMKPGIVGCRKLRLESLAQIYRAPFQRLTPTLLETEAEDAPEDVCN